MKPAKFFRGFFSNHVAKKHPVKVIWKFLWLQFKHKVLRDEFIFTLPTGTKMKATFHSSGCSAYFYFGFPDYEEQMFLLDNLAEGDLFVDIGANVGGWSLLALGRGACVRAYEPVPSTFEKLSENFQLNNINVKDSCYQLGLGSKSNRLVFSTDNDTGNKVVEREEYTGQVQEVSVETLDSQMMGHNPRFIKIDVEGFELEVLRGAFSTLSMQSIDALIIETFRRANFGDEKLNEIESILNKHGFKPCSYQPKEKVLTHLVPGEGAQNTLYVKADRFRIL